MTDTTTVRIVVMFLGMQGTLALAGLIWLISTGTEADRLAIVAGPVGALIGALATLLVSTRSSGGSGDGGTVSAQVTVNDAPLEGGA